MQPSNDTELLDQYKFIQNKLSAEINELKNAYEEFGILKARREKELKNEILRLEDEALTLKIQQKDREHSLEDDIEDLKIAFKSFKKKHERNEAELEDELTQVYRELKSLREGGDASPGDLRKQQKQMIKLEQKVKNAHITTQQLNSELKTLRDAMQQQQSREKQLQDEVSSTKQALQRLQRALEESERDKKELEGRLNRQVNQTAPVINNNVNETPTATSEEEATPPPPPGPPPPAPPPPPSNPKKPVSGGSINLTKEIEQLNMDEFTHVDVEEIIAKKLPYLHDIVDIHDKKIKQAWTELTGLFADEITKSLEIETLDALEPEMKRILSELAISIKLEQAAFDETIRRVFLENKNKIRTYYDPKKIQAIIDLLIKFASLQKQQPASSVLHQYLQGSTSKLSLQLSTGKETDPHKIMVKIAIREIPNNAPDIYNSIRRYLGFTTEKFQEIEISKREIIKKIYKTFIPLITETILSITSRPERRKLINDLLCLSDANASNLTSKENDYINQLLSKINLTNEDLTKLMTEAKTYGLEDKTNDYIEYLRKVIISVMSKYFIKCEEDFLKELGKKDNIYQQNSPTLFSPKEEGKSEPQQSEKIKSDMQPPTQLDDGSTVPSI